MADENQPEPKQRVRYNMAVTVDGVTHPAKTYEVEVVQSAAKALVAAGRAEVVSQHAQPAGVANAVAPVALTPQQVAAVAAALTQPAAPQPAPAAPATPPPAGPPQS